MLDEKRSAARPDSPVRPAPRRAGHIASLGLAFCALPLVAFAPQSGSGRKKSQTTAPKQVTPPAPAAPQQLEQPLDPTAIDRYDPQIYDVKFEVVMAGFPWDESQPAMRLENTPFVLPIIMRGPFSKVAPASLQPTLFMDTKQDKQITKRARLEDNKELGMTHALIPLKDYAGSTIRWAVSWKAQVWSCRIDEAVLAKKTWPREWRADVKEALKAQRGIESDQPFAKQIAESTLGPNPRSLPPWHAAKEILRRVVLGFKSVDTTTYECRSGERPIGLRFVGAAEAARFERGSVHDLVAVSVAALRAADIPARAVVGIIQGLHTSGAGKLTDLPEIISWGEVFVPEAGWIPFDPNELRGSAVRQLKVGDPWLGVGNIEKLNQRIPIAWCFAPQGYSSSRYATVWGWRPEGSTNLTSLEAVIQVYAVHKGKGIDDPNP